MIYLPRLVRAYSLQAGVKRFRMAGVARSRDDGASYLKPAKTIGPSNHLRKRAQPNTWSETQNKRTSSVQFLLLRRKVHPHGVNVKRSE
jgi:hypothetical protein